MSPSIWQLLIIVLIVVLLFGTKKLSGLGSDLGAAIKGFKKSMAGDDGTKEQPPLDAPKSDDSSKDHKPGA